MTATGVRPAGLDDRVQAAAAAESPDGLRRGSLSFARTIALSVGIQGPTAGVIVGPAVIASVVGGPGALAQVLGLVAMAFVAYAFWRFTRSFNTAGSVLAFNGTALGAGYGFVSAWLLLLVYTSFAGAVFASTASIAQSFAASLGLHAWWLWFALVGAVVAIALAYLSIGLSQLVILAVEGLAIVLVLIVGVTVVVQGGYHGRGLSAAPFRPSGVGVSVLALGVVNAFSQFSGFEGAATLGEESRRSTRTVPAAIAISLVLSAAVYIFLTWVAYGSFASPATLAADSAPLVTVAVHALGSGVGKVVNVAGIVSAFGAQLACITAGSRLVYALGREAGRPGNLLTRTSARTGAPVGGVGVVSGAALASLLAFSFEATAIRALTLIVTYGAYLLLVAYGMTVLAALVWTLRTVRRPVPVAVLTLGLAVMGYVLYRTFVPFPEAPFGAIVVAAGGSVLLGVALLAVPGLRRRLRGSPLLAVVAADRD